MKTGLNKKVLIQSLLALLFLALTYFVHWLFILAVAVLIWLNHRELFGKN